MAFVQGGVRRTDNSDEAELATTQYFQSQREAERQRIGRADAGRWDTVNTEMLNALATATSIGELIDRQWPMNKRHNGRAARSKLQSALINANRITANDEPCAKGIVSVRAQSTYDAAFYLLEAIEGTIQHTLKIPFHIMSRRDAARTGLIVALAKLRAPIESDDGSPAEGES